MLGRSIVSCSRSSALRGVRRGAHHAPQGTSFEPSAIAARLAPLGEKFDPNLHNALFEVPDPAQEPGTIAHVQNYGYSLHDRVIRPADVGIVAKR